MARRSYDDWKAREVTSPWDELAELGRLGGKEPAIGCSRRRTRTVERLLAVVIATPEGESVVRRNTQTGTIPWITDDPALAEMLLAAAIAESGFRDAYLAEFRREPPRRKRGR
jgi:hypothetical protein